MIDDKNIGSNLGDFLTADEQAMKDLKLYRDEMARRYRLANVVYVALIGACVLGLISAFGWF